MPYISHLSLLQLSRMILTFLNYSLQHLLNYNHFHYQPQILRYSVTYLQVYLALTYHNSFDKQYLTRYIHYHILAFVLLSILSHLDISGLTLTKMCVNGLDAAYSVKNQRFTAILLHHLANSKHQTPDLPIYTLTLSDLFHHLKDVFTYSLVLTGLPDGLKPFLLQT